MYDGVRVAQETGLSWMSAFDPSPSLPLTVIGIELGDGGVPVNWASLDLSRGDAGGPVDAGLALPSPANGFRVATHTFTAAPSGILSGGALNGSSDLAAVIQLLQPAPGVESSLESGATVVGSTSSTVTAYGADDPQLVPNWLLHKTTAANASWTVEEWVSDPFATSSQSTVLPVVTQLGITGTKLGDLAASATAPTFDSLGLYLTTPSGTPWRVYTAPGASLTISRLPDPPTDGLYVFYGALTNVPVVPMVLRFSSGYPGPWLLSGGDPTWGAHGLSVRVAPSPVTSLWR
jgi:hypothetical protein